MEEAVWHVWGEAPEVTEKLGWLAIAHLLESKELADALFYRGGQPPHQLGPQGGVGVSFWQKDNDILYPRGVPVVQLRDHIAELGLLAADAGQGKLCLGSGEPHGWSLGPELRESHGHSGYFCWRYEVRSTGAVFICDILVLLLASGKQLLLYTLYLRLVHAM